MPFLPPNQQRQSSEDKTKWNIKYEHQLQLVTALKIIALSTFSEKQTDT